MISFCDFDQLNCDLLVVNDKTGQQLQQILLIQHGSAI